MNRLVAYEFGGLRWSDVRDEVEALVKEGCRGFAVLPDDSEGFRWNIKAVLDGGVLIPLVLDDETNHKLERHCYNTGVDKLSVIKEAIKVYLDYHDGDD